MVLAVVAAAAPSRADDKTPTAPQGGESFAVALLPMLVGDGAPAVAEAD